jgi:hypothetical protein
MTSGDAAVGERAASGFLERDTVAFFTATAGPLPVLAMATFL